MSLDLRLLATQNQGETAYALIFSGENVFDPSTGTMAEATEETFADYAIDLAEDEHRLGYYSGSASLPSDGEYVVEYYLMRGSGVDRSADELAGSERLWYADGEEINHEETKEILDLLLSSSIGLQAIINSIANIQQPQTQQDLLELLQQAISELQYVLSRLN